MGTEIANAKNIAPKNNFFILLPPLSITKSSKQSLLFISPALNILSHFKFFL